MGIIDARLRVSNLQNVSGAAGSTVSTDVVDVQAPGAQTRDLGSGEPLYGLFWISGENMAGGTTLDMQLVVADNEALSVNLTVLASTGAVPLAELVVGARFMLQLPKMLRPPFLGRRYLGARYTRVGTFTNNNARISCAIMRDVEDLNKFYASGYAIA